MKEDIKYIRDKMDKMDDRMDDMQGTLVQNTAILDYHIKRTDILEGEVHRVRTHVDGVSALANGLKWLVGISGALIGIAYTVSKLFF